MIFKRALRNSLLTVFDSVVLKAPRGRASSDTRRARVLVMRFDFIGDFVLWLEAARGLRALYPADRFEITLLGNSAWTELARRLPHFDRVWDLERDRFLGQAAYRARMLARVRAERFDTVINPTYSRELAVGDALVRVSGARERIGFDGDCSNISPLEKRLADRWYTKLVPTTKGPLMELERHAEFVRGLGDTAFHARLGRLEANCPPPPGLDSGPFFLITPGASWSGRRWPVSSYAELARRIHDVTKWTAVISGSHAEAALGRELSRQLGFPNVDLTGRTTLCELVGAITKARLVIANETSTVHFAAALGRPALSIMGGGHYGRFLPYKVDETDERPLPVSITHHLDCFGCNWHCIHEIRPGAPVPCVERVGVEQAWDALQPLLRGVSR